MKKTFKKLAFSSMTALTIFSSATATSQVVFAQEAQQNFSTEDQQLKDAISKKLDEINKLHGHYAITDKDIEPWFWVDGFTEHDDNGIKYTQNILKNANLDTAKLKELEYFTKRTYYKLLYKKTLTDLKFEASDVEAYIDFRIGISDTYSPANNYQFENAQRDLAIIQDQAYSNVFLRVYIDDSYESQQIVQGIVSQNPDKKEEAEQQNTESILNLSYKWSQKNSYYHYIP
ncbi:hypothetical protein ABG811_09670 [Streptococcus iniae]